MYVLYETRMHRTQVGYSIPKHNRILINFCLSLALRPDAKKFTFISNFMGLRRVCNRWPDKRSFYISKTTNIHFPAYNRETTFSWYINNSITYPTFKMPFTCYPILSSSTSMACKQLCHQVLCLKFSGMPVTNSLCMPCKLHIKILPNFIKTLIKKVKPLDD